MFQNIIKAESKCDCENCSKQTVCRYKEAFLTYKEEVQKVGKGVLTPFNTNIECCEFSAKKREVGYSSYRTSDTQVYDRT